MSAAFPFTFGTYEVSFKDCYSNLPLAVAEAEATAERETHLQSEFATSGARTGKQNSPVTITATVNGAEEQQHFL